jgi:hypothetical protein
MVFWPMAGPLRIGKNKCQETILFLECTFLGIATETNR